MKISGFTFVKNASKLYIPAKEAILSILPICDEFVIALGDNDDDDNGSGNEKDGGDGNGDDSHDPAITFVPHDSDSDEEHHRSHTEYNLNKGKVNGKHSIATAPVETHAGNTDSSSPLSSANLLSHSQSSPIHRHKELGIRSGKIDINTIVDVTDLHHEDDDSTIVGDDHSMHSHHTDHTQEADLSDLMRQNEQQWSLISSGKTADQLQSRANRKNRKVDAIILNNPLTPLCGVYDIDTDWSDFNTEFLTQGKLFAAFELSDVIPLLAQ